MRKLVCLVALCVLALLSLGPMARACPIVTNAVAVTPFVATNFVQTAFVGRIVVVRNRGVQRGGGRQVIRQRTVIRGRR